MLKHITLFFAGAVVPASLYLAFNLFFLGQCDPKFGCMGTFNLVLTASIVPIALVGCAILFFTLLVIKINNTDSNWVYFVSGILVSFLNQVSFKLAQDYGFTVIILAVVLVTTLSFYVTQSLSRLVRQ